MKTLMIIEAFDPANRGVEWYDGETGEFLRAYDTKEVSRNNVKIAGEYNRLHNIKIPSTLEESKLWC